MPLDLPDARPMLPLFTTATQLTPTHSPTYLPTADEKYVRTLRRCSTSVKAHTFGMRLAGHKAAATALSTRWKVGVGRLGY